MAKRNAREGEIVRMDKFIFGREEYGPFWVQVTCDIDRSGFNFAAIDGPPEIMGDELYDNEWICSSTEDEWTFVDEEDVPDHVWALVAKRKLLDG